MKNIKFINAGAGSGKTYTLTNILAANISDGRCNADEVILTTFTENSAAELKARARETLLKRNKTTQANLLASAAIGTVHSVAFQLIKRYWYHLGISVELDVMSEDDKVFFLNQALANVPTQGELMQLREIAEQLSFKQYMSSLTNYDLWKDHLSRIVEHAITNRMDDLEASKTASLVEARQVFPIDPNVVFNERGIQSTLTSLSPLFDNDADNPTTQKRINNIEEIRGKKNWSLPEFVEARSVLQNTTTTHKDELPQINVHLEELAGIYSSEPVISEILAYIEIVFNLAQRSLDALRTYKTKNRLIDYNDMESMLLRLLDIGEVQLEIKNTFKQVYVDEFQDSSPIQFEIFNRLSELVEQSYWVGDPKQAIYGFRGTNPELISAVIETFQGERDDLTIDNLDKSWRSRPGIVNLCNDIFTPALIDQVKDEKYIKLSSVRADNELPLDKHHPTVQHWHLKDDKKGGGNDALKWHHHAESIYAFLNDEAINVTQKDLCKYYRPEEKKDNIVVTNKLRPKDVAILCKTNDSISDLAANLRGFGIKVAGKQKGIKETAEIQLLIAAINYLLDHTDQLAKSVLLLLSGEFDSTADFIDKRLEHIYSEDAPAIPGSVGVTDEEEKKKMYMDWSNYLNEWSPDSSILSGIELMQKDIAISSIPVIVERLIIEGGLYDLVRQWDNAGQRMANLETLIKTANGYDERCLNLNIAPSPAGFIRHIEKLDEKNFMQSAATGDDAINIMTYHGAKGLEWPVVILTELEKQKADEKSVAKKAFFGVSNENPEKIDPEKPFEGKIIKLIPWPFGSTNSNIETDIENRIKQTPRYLKELVKERNEASRLLYVGFTRARDILISTSYRKKKPEWLSHVCGEISLISEIDGKPAGEYLLPFFNVGGNIPVKVMEFDTEMLFPEIDEASIRIHSKKTKKEQGNPKYVSPSSIRDKEKYIVVEIADFRMRIEVGKIAPEKEAELGNCLHDIYALYNPGHEDQLFIDHIKKTVANHDLHGNLTHSEHVLKAVKNIFDFLEKEYGKACRIYREIPLQYEENGVIYRGEADLLWETKDGLILVDYKSFPGGRSALLSSDNDHYAGNYAGQLKIYKKMIETGHPEGMKVLETLLYYSVSGLVLKVDIS